LPDIVDAMTRARAQAVAAVLLALAAGCVDAVSFTVLHDTFTANMTGNSTQLGLLAGRGDGTELVPLAVAVLAFVVAIILGTAAIEVAARRGLAATAAPALLAEAGLLAVFMLAGRDLVRHHTTPDHATGFYLLLTVAVLAMGIQTASLTKALGTTVRTTYVSGMLTTFAQELVNLLAPADAGAHSHLRDDLGLGSRRTSLARLCLHVGVWGSFVAGAAWGGYGERRWSTLALALPVAAVLAAAAVDLRRPVR
jgi:uncharacterized membrane protein YoaK (UPF0700 family)